MQYQEVAVVIGNGESRSILDLESLRTTVTLIGCNAIHRDLLVDHLVCCDNRMVKEVVGRKKSRKLANIYTRERYFKDFKMIDDSGRVKLLPELPYNGLLKPDQAEHWGSGPYAVLLAAALKFKCVYIIGFDLHGNNHLVNNLYKDTPNYLSSNKPAVDPAYWIYQLKKVFAYHPDVQFKIFNFYNWACPSEWRLDNVTVFDINKFNIELAKEVNTLYN